MKSKKSVYVLLFAVVIIWALIIYRVVVNIGFTPDTKKNSDYSLMQQNETLKLDSFNILANYRDPFLGKERANESDKTAIKSNSSKKSIREPEIKLSIVKPSYNIKYKGLIYKQNTKASFAMLNIDGKELLLQDKGNYKDLTVLRVYRDSILFGSSSGNFYIKKK